MTLPAPTDEPPADSSSAIHAAEPARVAFSILVRQHHRSLLAYARAINANAGADLVQEALITAYKKLGSFEPSADFAAWVRGIIRNKWREHCRKRQEDPLGDEALERIDAQYAAWSHSTAEAQERNPVLQKLEQCLSKLPDTLRDAVEAYYFQARNSDEAASHLGANPASIRKRLERARTALRECLATPELA
jgi:RNA polymerase sigma factor CnrH